MLDTDLAEFLGYSTPANIRRVVRANIKQLRAFGSIGTVAKTPGLMGGRPGQAYYLNEDQAVYLSVRSETENCSAVCNTKRITRPLSPP